MKNMIFPGAHLGVQSLSPYIPGKAINEVMQEQGISDIIKLASNENPLGCSSEVQKVLHSASSKVTSIYPVWSSHPLRQELSNHLGVPDDYVILSNGSDLLFTLLILTFALHTGRRVVTHDYAFITYELQAQALGVAYHKVPLNPQWEVNIEALIKACQEKPALLFLANPNNPTGTWLSLTSIHTLLENIPTTSLVVLDEAYFEYIPSSYQYDSVQLLSKFPHLIITRTFSKAYGLAGLRLGFGIAHPQIIELLTRVQLPFTVNQIALDAGIVAVHDQAFVQKTIAANAEGMQQMKTGFNRLQLEYLASEGNFISINCQTNALPIYQALLRHGIIVRPLHPYGLHQYLRISIGTSSQNARFLDKLETCLSQQEGIIQ